MRLYQQAITRYKDSTPEQKSYLHVVLTLGLLILLILLIFPAINHILKLNKEISDGRVLEQKLEEKLIDLETAEANYAELKDRLSITEEALPSGTEVELHLKQLENLTSKNKTTLEGLQFSNIPLSKPKETQNLNLQQIDYSITVSGRYSDLSSFLADLNNLIRTTDINTVSIGGEGSNLSASVNAIIYYLGKSSLSVNQEGGRQTTQQ